MDRNTLKMYQSLNVDIDKMINEFIILNNTSIEEINWEQFDLYVAKLHNYKLEVTK